MDQRGTFSGKLAPGPFHCLGCQSFVTGTASGHCPRCGFVPPIAMILPEDTPTYAMPWASIAMLVMSIVALAIYSL